ncbi:hypothetical protein BJ508DRAFT_335057 [Ascobolus immersus RN42]|uniref:Uncharacterized protein n=1 Tax=Ascobolus immersus RN42 TaxID=1160509 RepID=A0A3N4HRW9_ASCIM|nr:hypothetical protein BJ508DRAFT_335057 [Ascobolus immersus RN42]
MTFSLDQDVIYIGTNTAVIMVSATMAPTSVTEKLAPYINRKVLNGGHTTLPSPERWMTMDNILVADYLRFDTLLTSHAVKKSAITESAPFRASITKIARQVC